MPLYARRRRARRLDFVFAVPDVPRAIYNTGRHDLALIVVTPAPDENI